MKYIYLSFSCLFSAFAMLLPNLSLAQTNPFGIQTLPGTTVNSAPAFADLDNDGDQDMLSGKAQGEFYYYENIGTATNPSFDTRMGDYFSLDVGASSKPVFVDLDNDGDFDIMSGESFGNFYYYENTGTVTNPSFGSLVANPFGLADAGTATSPAFVDLDNDGDLDLLVESLGLGLSYFENTGTSSAPAFGTIQSNPFGLTGTSHISITTIDIEGDGDFDVFLGDSDGKIDLYENIGTASVPLFEEASYNTFGDSDVGSDATPSAVDLNGDGFEDLMVGDRVGDFTFFEINISTLPTGFLAPLENPFNLTDINSADNGTSPSLVDLDNDNDFDVLMGSFTSGFHYFENIGTQTVPDFDDRQNNPFGLTTAALALVPDFADLDNDGDLDLMAGGNVGNFFYMENTGTISAPSFGAAQSNPFGLVKMNSRASVALVDIDNDGDYDLLAGDASNGDITYFENTGSVSAPTFSAGQSNPFGLEENGLVSSIITMEDMDGDSDLDLVIGTFSVRYLYVENIGTVSSPEFATPRAFENFSFGRPSPAVADLDNDGDLDILSGSFSGELYYSENRTIFVNTPPIFTSSAIPPTFNENGTGIIIDINANDGNSGADDENISYSVTGGADQSLFSIDTDNGELSFISPPDFEAPQDNGGNNVYDIVVTANDGESNNNLTTQNIAISVSDVEEPVEWLGLTSVWSSSSNWSTGQIPFFSKDVIIPATANDPVISASNRSVKDITIEDGVTVTINSGTGLWIAGDVVVNGSGQVTINRNMKDDRGYSVLGSPLINKKVGDFNADLIYGYTDASNEFTIPLTTDDLNPGTGYFVGYEGTDPTASLSGIPVNEDVSVTLFNTGTGENGIDDGFNLVANPFITSLSRTGFVVNNSTAFSGTIWFWNDGGANSGSSRSGDYVSVNNSGVTSSDPNINFNLGTPIGFMQGFFVQSSAPSGSTATLNFTTDMATNSPSTDANFFRKETEEVEEKTLKLSLSGQGELDDLYNDIVIALRSDATNEDDFALDAIKFSGNEYISFYSLNNDKHYAIQALPLTIENNIEVSLGFNLKLTGNYQIKVQDLNFNKSHLRASLTDLQTGVSYDLSEDTTIPFSVTQPGEIADRFRVSFSQFEALIIDENLPYPITIQGDDTHLQIGSSAGNKTVQVIDLQGKILFSEQVFFDNGTADLKVTTEIGQPYILIVDDESVKFVLR